MKKLLLLISLSLLMGISTFAQQFTGNVLDSSGQKPIPFASIYLVELQTGVTTDIDGNFSLSPNLGGQVHFQISCIGYQTAIYFIDLSTEKKKIFYLAESHLQLHEVVISASSIKLQQDNIVAVVQKNISELNLHTPTNLTEAISNIPGIENYSTGAGIGKPVIRGLSGNRIVVYAQNVRIENQQWGDEHGLGIGEVGIENVEVIKGPSSLLYGADALGGVLYFVDERYAALNSFESFISTKFLSNTLGTFNDVGIKLNKGNFRVNLFGSYNSNTDYQLPNANRVLNSRFSESNFKTSLGYHYKKWFGNIRYSFLNNHFGITETDTASTSTERKPELPNQTVANNLLSFDNTFFLNKTKLTATFGYNQNDRKEYEDNMNIPNLNLVLQTFTYNIRSNTAILKNKLDLIAGLQGMSQQNKNKAEELLIPDASINDLGTYAVINYTPISKLTFEGGIRVDISAISTTEMTTPDIFFPELKKDFNNFNFALGSSYQLKAVSIKANIASGFRPPNTSELLSNGVHEGTLRYEIGNNNLKSEKATQIDISIEYEKEHFSLYINPFYNHINQYIYLSPSDSTIENLPVFYYLQSQANLYGTEIGIHWHPHPVDWLHIEGNYSSVFGKNKTDNPLPLIPANKIQTSIKGEFKSTRKIKLESVFIEHVYRFKQNRIATYETTTKAYQLFNAGMIFQIISNNHNIEISTGVKNILNSKYLDHLSRFKEIGIYNAGINSYIGLKWNLQSNKN